MAAHISVLHGRSELNPAREAGDRHLHAATTADERHYSSRCRVLFQSNVPTYTAMTPCAPKMMRCPRSKRGGDIASHVSTPTPIKPTKTIMDLTRTRSRFEKPFGLLSSLVSPVVTHQPSATQAAHLRRTDRSSGAPPLNGTYTAPRAASDTLGRCASGWSSKVRLSRALPGSSGRSCQRLQACPALGTRSASA